MPYAWAREEGSGLGRHRRSQPGSVMTDVRRKRPFVLHPLLFAAVPVLILWSSNVKEDVPLGDVLRPLGLIVGITLAVFLVLGVLLRGQLMKAGTMVTVLVVLFFSYGEVQRAVSGVPVLGSQWVLLAVWAALAVVGVRAAGRAAAARLVTLTKGLNFVAAGLVLVNLGSIGLYKFQSRGGPTIVNDVQNIPLKGSPEGPAAASAQPDVYYIMLEEYGGQKALRDIFHFDNTPFLNSLRDRGFYVVEHATTNYPHTVDSLASSLNLQYVQHLIKPSRYQEDDWSPAYELIRDDEVPKFFKSRGYEYIHVGSRWTPTSTNPQADVNIRMPGSLSEFSQSLLGTTALNPGASLYNRIDFQKFEFKRVHFEFDQLAKLPQAGGPKFVFGHILIPHLPFIFDAKGHFLDNDGRDEHSEAYNYVQQLRYANTLTEHLIDSLLSGYPVDAKPIIVLQSDEGPYDGLDDGTNATDEELEQHLGILNAYYFPRVSDTRLYPRITPVNSFRLVLDDYFGANLPLLPDRNYVFADRSHIYSFIDVTERAHSLS
jgi:hypothetical protein